MKKQAVVVAFCAMVIGCIGYVGYKATPKNVEVSALLANVEALSRNEEVVYDYKIAQSCDCWGKGADGFPKFYGMSILACERYEWTPPMVKQDCHTTSCQGGEC